jgi:uncharacterized protein (TIRG00374 family)
MKKGGMKTVARYAFAVIVLALILYLLDTNDVIETMAGANIASVAIAVAWSLGTRFFAAVRLRLLLVMQGALLSLRRVYFVGLSAVFYGLLVPGGTIAAFMARFVQFAKDARVEAIGAALVVDRVVATVFLLAVGAVAIALDRADPLWAGVIVVGTVLATVAVLFGRRSVPWLSERMDSIAGDGSSSRWRRLLADIGRAFLNYSDATRSQMLIVVATSLIAHLCGCLAFYTIALGIELDLSFLTVCWIRSGIILSAMLPISVAGLGVRELTAIALLAPLGFAEAEAVAFSILIFLVTPVTIGLIGGLGEAAGATSR